MRGPYGRKTLLVRFILLEGGHDGRSSDWLPGKAAQPFRPVERERMTLLATSQRGLRLFLRCVHVYLPVVANLI